MQKRVMRLITFNDLYPEVPGPLSPSDPIFNRLAILKITDVYQLQILKFIFKSICKLTPVNFHDWFLMKHDLHCYGTRSAIYATSQVPLNNLHIPFARTSNYGLKKIKVIGPRIWNNLPNSIKNLSSFHIFCRSVKIHFISAYLSTI